jgi:hypothetical protein
MSDLNGELLDHYQILDQIGQGGMATVYRAVDKRDGREVAIKVLAPSIGTDRRFVKRFRREASLVSSLNHPNIVPVLEYGQARGFVYTAMPYVSGETLHRHIVNASITTEENVRWVGEISEALGFAHDHGVIHRDVKPANVIISESGSAQLTDFGLARVVEGHSSLTGSMLMGTPAYISPEQGKGEDLDPRSDQYSLGVILYEMATGRLPFDSEAPMATVLQHIQEPVPRPRRFAPDLSPDVEAVILKSLAKKRDLRFENIRAMNEAYQAAMIGAPIPKFDVPSSVAQTQVKAAAKPLRAHRTVLEHGVRKNGTSRWVGFAVLAGGIALVAIVMGVLFGGGFISVSRGDDGQNTAPESAVETESVILLASSTELSALIATVQPTPVVSASCPGLSLYPLPNEGNRAQWILDNGGSETFTLNGIRVESWPFANGDPTVIHFGDVTISASGGEDIVSDIDPADRSLEPGQSKLLSLEFQYAAGDGDYSYDLIFDGACTIGISGGL